MFKEIRRKDREIANEQLEDILLNGEYGTLSTISDNGYPYSVPLNYVYYDKCIYFHCAKEGHKLENIKQNNKVSFSVVIETEVLPGKFSTKYKSIIAFGTASEVADNEKETILLQFIEKYSKDFLEEGKNYINRAIGNTEIVKIDIDHMTGKARN